MTVLRYVDTETREPGTASAHVEGRVVVLRCYVRQGFSLAAKRYDVVVRFDDRGSAFAARMTRVGAEGVELHGVHLGTAPPAGAPIPRLFLMGVPETEVNRWAKL